MIEPIDLGIPGLTNIERIGAGGNAIVYRARQADLDRDVVVKVLMNIDADTTRRRFDRERRAMGRLSQTPGIAPLYGSGFTPSGQPYLLMPLYEQGSLQDQLERGGALAPDQVRSIGVTIARAVQTAHENGVLHRDLKPANILMRKSGDSDVADFGIAHLTDDALGTSQALTMTPLYTAPEVFDGVESGAAADVYSLGATLFALLNGYPAYADPQGGTPVLALMRRINEDPLPTLPASVPKPLAAVIAQAMSKNPGARQATAGELAAALEAVDLSVRDQSRRSRVVFAVIGAVVVAAIVGGVVAMLRDGGSESVTDDDVAIATSVQVETPPPVATPTQVVPSPAPVQDLVDTVAAGVTARQALVRVEAFSCTGVDVATGVVLNDGIILTTADVFDSPWHIDVTLAGTSVGATAQSAASPLGFGFLQLDDPTAFDVLQGASVGDGEQVAVVGIDGRVAVGTVAPALEGKYRPIANIDAGDGNAIESGDIVLTAGGGLAGIASVSARRIELIEPGQFQQGTVITPNDDCDTLTHDVGPSGSEFVLSPAIAELLVMQRLSDSYASEDWDLVRILEPAKETYPVAKFEEGWRPLRQGYVFPVQRSIDGAGLSSWRIGLVGHETWNAVDITTLFCVTWLVDPVSGSVTQTFDDAVTIYGSLASTEQLNGFVDPGSLRAQIESTCQVPRS